MGPVPRHDTGLAGFTGGLTRRFLLCTPDRSFVSRGGTDRTRVTGRTNDTAAAARTPRQGATCVPHAAMPCIPGGRAGASRAEYQKNTCRTADSGIEAAGGRAARSTTTGGGGFERCKCSRFTPGGAPRTGQLGPPIKTEAGSGRPLPWRRAVCLVAAPSLHIQAGEKAREPRISAQRVPPRVRVEERQPG